jgi:hypothetical protein
MTMLKREHIPSNVIDRLEHELERLPPGEALAIALSVWKGFRLTPAWELRTNKKSVTYSAPLIWP